MRLLRGWPSADSPPAYDRPQAYFILDKAPSAQMLSFTLQVLCFHSIGMYHIKRLSNGLFDLPCISLLCIDTDAVAQEGGLDAYRHVSDGTTSLPYARKAKPVASFSHRQHVIHLEKYYRLFANLPSRIVRRFFVKEGGGRSFLVDSRAEELCKWMEPELMKILNYSSLAHENV